MILVSQPSIRPAAPQTLLIYFATDDAQNLRPIAKRRWSPFGRVVFGPLQREIGHMSPQWTQKDLDAERERDKESGSTAQPSAQAPKKAAGKAKMEVVIPSTHNPDLPVRTAKSEHAVRRHADWGFAEWWVLYVAVRVCGIREWRLLFAFQFISLVHVRVCLYLCMYVLFAIAQSQRGLAGRGDGLQLCDHRHRVGPRTARRFVFAFEMS
jgi:hypothetical protein